MMITAAAATASLSNSTSHYGKPPCLPDEQIIDAAGRGQVCAAKCNAKASSFPGTCPSDVPDGSTLKPSCAIQDSDDPFNPNARYCALTCFVSSGCPPGSTCQHILMLGLEGLCVYPNGDLVADIKLSRTRLRNKQYPSDQVSTWQGRSR